jgi:hypothetical protein
MSIPIGAEAGAAENAIEEVVVPEVTRDRMPA